MVQILVLAAVALFLFWRLRSVLGSRQGFEKNTVSTEDIKVNKKENKVDSNVIELKANEVNEEIADYVEINSPAFDALSEMKEVEKGWLVSHFVSGAKMAYEQILMAFEKGDLQTIKKMTSDEVCESFKTVIDERNKEQETLIIDLKSIQKNEILSSKITKTTFSITVGYESLQVKALLDKNDELIDGDIDKEILVKDAWVFQRKIKNDNPNWTLVETKSN